MITILSTIQWNSVNFKSSLSFWNFRYSDSLNYYHFVVLAADDESDDLKKNEWNQENQVLIDHFLPAKMFAKCKLG